jgi:hypothetical protein
MALERLIFDLDGTKVHISTEAERTHKDSFLYRVEALVEAVDLGDLHSFIRFDMGKRIFIDMPDGVQILGLSQEEAYNFRTELNQTYSDLLRHGQITLQENAMPSGYKFM